MAVTWNPGSTTNLTVVYNNQRSSNNQPFVVSLPSSILIQGALNVYYINFHYFYSIF